MKNMNSLAGRNAAARQKRGVRASSHILFVLFLLDNRKEKILMSTSLRPELSERNPNYISRHRYYELKHFCMQYYEWKRQLAELDGLIGYSADAAHVQTSEQADPTEKVAAERVYFSERIEMVDSAAIETDEALAPFIILGVTKGISYDVIRMKMDIPCCKETYYNLYRRFLCILDRKRG
jgi:hypothetical protein